MIIHPFPVRCARCGGKHGDNPCSLPYGYNRLPFWKKLVWWVRT